MGGFMSHLICYCSGGIGNRLKPIASCWHLANITNRKLVIVWELALRCLAPFDSLFTNNINLLPQTSIPYVTNIKVYTPDGAAEYEKNLNGVVGLWGLVKNIGSTPIDTQAIINDKTENILVFSNTFLPEISKEDHKKFFSNYLKINPKIIKEVDLFWNHNKMNSNFIGVHARGTDFEDSGINVNYYLNKMASNPHFDFFVCSDSQDYEKYIKENDKRNIIIRENKIYVSKNKEGKWSNNVYTPTESVQDSLVDLLLLSKTNFQIHHPNSSFAHLVEYFKI
jgi:hypothetical protein